MKENKLIKALVFAEKIHRGQKRLDGMPYIWHPLATMIILVKYNYVNERLLTAAVLHDVIEDGNVQVQDLREMFGNGIAQMVEDVSIDKNGNFPLLRLESHHIKMADRIHNLRECPDWMLERYISKTEKLLAQHPRFAEASQSLYKELLRTLNMARKRSLESQVDTGRTLEDVLEFDMEFSNSTRKKKR